MEYVLAPSSGTHIGASLHDGCIRVEVPARELSTWCDSNQVGLSAAIAVDNGATLSVLIEKDFRCLDNRDHEDQSDTFENTIGAHISCEPTT